MENKNNLTKIYEVRDLWEAGALLTKGLELKGVKNLGGICYFLFENVDKCSELSEAYKYNKLQVVAIDYRDALNRLKGLIYN